MNNDKIHPFRFWTQHVLPLVYDDSLSYLEVLYKVKIKLNEVIDWANGFTDELYNYIDEKTQENLKIMQQEMAQYKQTIDYQLNELQTNVDNVNNRLDSIISEVNTIINNFQTEINKSFDDFKADISQQLNEQNDKVTAQLLAQNVYVQTQIALINSKLEENKQWNKKYTDDEIKKVIKLIPDLTELLVYSPVTGIKGTVQIALNDLYKLFLELGEPITAKEYDDLQLTASEYDNKNLTAYKYDYYGKKYLIGSIKPEYQMPVYSSTPQICATLDGKNVYRVRLENNITNNRTQQYTTDITVTQMVRFDGYILYNGMHNANYCYTSTQFLRCYCDIVNGKITYTLNKIGSDNPGPTAKLVIFAEYMED